MQIIHHFVVDDLKWLRKGGRLSNASAIIGTLLNIKPILYVSDEGKLIASSKVRGRKHALLNIVNSMKDDLGDPAGKDIYLFHADCKEDAQFMADKMMELYPTLNSTQLFMEGPTVGCHVGPGFISIHYLGTKRMF
jgi:DegV family protein with EDD domain